VARLRSLEAALVRGLRSDHYHDHAAARCPPHRASAIDGFCQAENMSRAFFYAMQRRGMGPQVTEIILPPEPGVNRGRGLRLLRISAAAHREWRERIASGSRRIGPKYATASGVYNALVAGNTSEVLSSTYSIIFSSAKGAMVLTINCGVKPQCSAQTAAR
jgi:hypothetical protein